MSQLKLPINYKSLELELQEALRADTLNKLQNDAKLRAVEQNVSTYENFRQMVNAAHLQPLRCSDLTPKVKGFWNPISNNDNSDTVVQLVEFTKKQSNKSKNNNDLEDELANTYKQFIQVWKTMEEDETKFNYLRRSRNILREKIFHTEIPSLLFAEIINVCSKTVTAANNIADVVDILNILSKCNRFYLTICFMGKNERQMCTKLFHDLFARNSQDNMLEETIQLLKSSYGIESK